MSGETAVIDRICDGIAVLVLDRSKETLELPSARLPAWASEGQVVRVLRDADVWQVEPLEEETMERERRVRGKLDRLRNRPKSP